MGVLVARLASVNRGVESGSAGYANRMELTDGQARAGAFPQSLQSALGEIAVREAKKEKAAATLKP